MTGSAASALAVLWTIQGINALNAQDSGARLLEQANAAYRSLKPAEAARLYRQYLASYRDRADVRVFLGGALLNMGDLQPAMDEAQHAIALDARYGKGYLLAARVAAAREHWDEAQSFFNRAEKLDPGDPDAWYFSGRAWYDANRFEPAIAAFQEALRIGAGQSRVYEALGQTQDALGQPQAAEKSFRKAVDSAGNSWRPYLSYGAFLYRQGRPAESLRELRRALALAPESSEVRFELARVLYQENNIEEAARVLEPARASRECRIHNLLARIYTAAGTDGPAEAEVRALGNCKPAPGER